MNILPLDHVLKLLCKKSIDDQKIFYSSFQSRKNSKANLIERENERKQHSVRQELICYEASNDATRSNAPEQRATRHCQSRSAEKRGQYVVKMNKKG